jgi:hypothetical protein
MDRDGSDSDGSERGESDSGRSERGGSDRDGSRTGYFPTLNTMMCCQGSTSMTLSMR